MSTLAAALLAAGGLVCQFGDETMLLYAMRGAGDGSVIDSRRVGSRPVLVREEAPGLHLVEEDGQSVRVTVLGECTRTKFRRGVEVCTRYAAHHAWHFDLLAVREPAASLRRQPSGAATGSCEPWRVD